MAMTVFSVETVSFSPAAEVVVLVDDDVVLVEKIPPVPPEAAADANIVCRRAGPLNSVVAAGMPLLEIADG